jgi:signal peptidase I
MSDDDLYTGPTVLGPRIPDENRLADHLARWMVVPLLILIGIIILVFYILFSSAVVNGDSMSPTLWNGDYLLITHGVRALHRGDIVVTRVVEQNGPVELVKRVVALPGDTVEIRRDVAYVNGVAEPARGQFIVQQLGVSRAPMVVPPGSIYLLGDNRAVSEDSRYFGPAPVSGIKGVAVFVFAPIMHVHAISRS